MPATENLTDHSNPTNPSSPNPTTAAAASSIECPECAASVAVGGQLMVHEIVSCADCGAELEVLSLDPLTVDLAPEVEEDWGE